jgi:hypothetical protein
MITDCSSRHRIEHAATDINRLISFSVDSCLLQRFHNAFAAMSQQKCATAK